MATSWVSRLLKDVDAFRADHWQLRPYLRQSFGFEPTTLFGPQTVNEIIGGSFARTPFVRLVKAGYEMPTSTYTRATTINSTRLTGFPDPERIAGLMADGASLVLDAVHHGVPAVGRAVRDFATEFGQVAQANAYITPPASRGLNLHFDRDDVFVIQCAGRKSWRVYRPEIELPLHGGPASNIEPNSPEIEVELAEGDLLYIPRGWLHIAATSDVASYHLSVGVLAVTVADALGRVIQSIAGRDSALRAELPLAVGKSAQARAALAAGLRQAAALVEERDAATALDMYRQHLESTLAPQPPDLLAAMSAGFASSLPR